MGFNQTKQELTPTVGPMKSLGWRIFMGLRPIETNSQNKKWNRFMQESQKTLIFSSSLRTMQTTSRVTTKSTTMNSDLEAEGKIGKKKSQTLRILTTRYSRIECQPKKVLTIILIYKSSTKALQTYLTAIMKLLLFQTNSKSLSRCNKNLRSSIPPRLLHEEVPLQPR